jgi:uncharacterized protein YbaA (DUF1428 family)
MSYVDGFVLAVPEKKLGAYRKIATLASKVWKEYGALEYVEAVSDDVPKGKITDFYGAVKAKKGEVIVFSYVVYKSRKHRDAVIKKVMADPRMKTDPSEFPFDAKRMIFGGFKPFIEVPRS